MRSHDQISPLLIERKVFKLTTGLFNPEMEITFKALRVSSLFIVDSFALTTEVALVELGFEGCRIFSAIGRF